MQQLIDFTRTVADQVMVYGGQLGIPNPTVTLLAPGRRAALDETLEQFGPNTRALSAAVRAGDPEARRAFARAADSALAQLRRRAQDHAAQTSRVHQALARADRWWADTDAGEHIDDPTLDPALRRRAMANLDRVNELLGSYEAFFERLRPMMAGLGDRPLRILELAAGHGGFALSLAHMARRRGLALEITATDVEPEYLELGRERAQGLALRYELQDALDLRAIEPGRYDLVVCTQALHHFAPGDVALMLAEATRVAGRSVVFIDGARTIMHAAPLYAYLRGQLHDPILAHDAWISCRRFYMPEELLLLARLGPWGEHASARWMPPSHCVLEVPA